MPASSVLSVSRKSYNPDELPVMKFTNRTRFLILVLCTACLSIAQSDTLTLNFTIICMSPPKTNGTQSTIADDRIAHGTYEYTPNEKSLLFSLVAVGAMVAVYPVMWLIQIYGSRKIVFLMGMLSAVTTAAIPYTVYLGFYWFLAMRFLQGTGLSTGFTLIGIVTRQWSMQKQSAFFIAVLTCLFQLGPIFTMPVAGVLCTSSLGWPSVYYLHAVVTFGLFVLFYYFYRESPSSHAFVSEKELARIQRGKGETKRQPIPYLAIIRDMSILSCWCSAVGNFGGIQVTMQYSPTYLNKVMGFPVETTGAFSAVPQIATFILKLFAGYAADKITCCPTVVSVKIFNCLAIGGMGITFFGLAYVPTSMPIVGLVMLTLCCTIVGFNCGAFFRSSAIVAAQHNHFIMGVNSFINCFCALLAPVVVNIFVTNDTWDEWWYVWMTYFVVLTIANIVFCIFGKGEPAEWTKSQPSGCSVAAACAPPVAAFDESSMKV